MFMKQELETGGEVPALFVNIPHAMHVVQKAYSYTKTSHDTITEVPQPQIVTKEVVSKWMN